MWLWTLPITRSSSASASFGQIHRAVAQDVALEAGEDADAQAAVWFSSRTCWAKATARFSSRPLAMASALEWSVMAMYS